MQLTLARTQLSSSRQRRHCSVLAHSNSTSSELSKSSSSSSRVPPKIKARSCGWSVVAFWCPPLAEVHGAEHVRTAG